MNPFAGYEDEATGEFINTGKEDNKARQKYVLLQMYDNGSITYDEYQAALNEELIFTDSDEYQETHPEEDNEYLSAEATSWVVDTAIYEFADYLEKDVQPHLQRSHCPHQCWRLSDCNDCGLGYAILC